MAAGRGGFDHNRRRHRQPHMFWPARSREVRQDEVALANLAARHRRAQANQICVQPGAHLNAELTA